MLFGANGDGPAKSKLMALARSMTDRHGMVQVWYGPPQQRFLVSRVGRRDTATEMD
jgi:hypothetical protein